MSSSLFIVCFSKSQDMKLAVKLCVLLTSIASSFSVACRYLKLLWHSKLLLLSSTNDYQNNIRLNLHFDFTFWWCIHDVCTFITDRRDILTPWIGQSMMHYKPTHSHTSSAVV